MALFFKEQAYLRRVLQFIDEREAYLRSNTRSREDESFDLKAAAWEEHLELSAQNSNGQFDSAMMQDELARNAQVIYEQNQELKVLQRIRKEPFFGHITFRFMSEEYEEPGEYYIGLKDLIDSDRFTQYVIDWRSPLATVYYNVNEIGPTSFKNRERRIAGELLAKYQLVIQDSKLLRALNTSEQILDEILQMVLSSLSSAKMKAIAQTIQREQNRIIRSEMNRVLIIQGVAGSGKTSIALHRAAYMMYVDPLMRADNILLVTPSESFATYISSVLPDLGEENVRSLTILQILRQELGDVEARYLDYVFAPAPVEKWQAMGTFEWVEWCQEFVAFLSENMFQPQEIDLPYLKVPARLLGQLYHINYRHLPPFRRHEAILRHLRDLVSNPLDYQQAYNQLDEELRSMFLLHDLRQTYEVFTHWAAEEKNIDIHFFSSGSLNQADVSLLTLLKILMYGPSEINWVRHLIVDEMQDLTGLAHECLRRIFKCPRTLLGDVNQAIRFPISDHYLAELQSLYQVDPMRTEFYELRTSYRSTLEITEFARQIVQDESILPLERHGSPVKITCFADHQADEQLAHTYELLLAWRRQGYRTAAVLCADEAGAAAMRAGLEALSAAEKGEKPLIFNDYLKEEKDFAVTVCDVFHSKGIEFDTVLVHDASAQYYHENLDRVKLYVSCTRALHELHLTVLGEPSPFLPAVALEGRQPVGNEG